MAYLEGFGLENFRVFKEYTWFDFAPITILVGPNSSGKSSLIKALLLMEDNINPYKKTTEVIDKSKLNFSGLLHNLGSLDKTLSKERSSDVLSFVIPIIKAPNKQNWIFSEEIYRRFDFLISENRGVNLDQNNIVCADGTPIYTKKEYGKIYLNLPLLRSLLVEPDSMMSLDEEENRLLKNAIEIIKNSKICRKEPAMFRELDLWKNFEVDKYPPIKEQRIYYPNGEYEDISWDQDQMEGQIEYQGKLYQLPAAPYRTFHDSYVISLYLGILFPGNDNHTRELATAVCQCLKQTELVVQWPHKLNYLPSIKGSTKRSYQVGDDHTLNKIIDDIKSETSSYESRRKFLARWSTVFNLDEIKIERSDNLNANFVEVGGLSLADVGYGYTQLTALLLSIIAKKEFKRGSADIHLFGNFPPILASITSSNDEYIHKLILLEEPESNLHPKFQSQLADLLVAARAEQYADQFIIETHSEYMIRKFQYLVAKGKLKSEDIVIHYFHDPNNIPADEKQVKKITILEDGSLSDDFGPGFYDEAANLELELLRLKRNKARQN